MENRELAKSTAGTMPPKKANVRLLTQMGLLTGLMVVMAFTPLGYIPLGFMNATTMHIPVIPRRVPVRAQNGRGARRPVRRYERYPRNPHPNADLVRVHPLLQLQPGISMAAGKA